MPCSRPVLDTVLQVLVVVVFFNLICCLVAKSCLTLWRPHGLYATRLLCPWDFPGKNNGVGNLPRPEIKPTSPAMAVRFFTTEPPGKSNLLLIGG